jgi:hypothetical protein
VDRPEYTARFPVVRTHARTYRYTGFTITGTHTFTTLGTRTLMSHERVDQVDSHTGGGKAPAFKPTPNATRRVNTNCTTLMSQPQLHRTVSDNITHGKMVTWFVSSLPTDNRPQPKEALLTVSQL